jgi:hypothetical protein
MTNTKLTSAIKKFKSNRAKQLEERKSYLASCRIESERIFSNLVEDISTDLEIAGVAYINVIDKYSSIFQFQIRAIVADMLHENGLELTLFQACGVIKVHILDNDTL